MLWSEDLLRMEPQSDDEYINRIMSWKHSKAN